MYTRIDVDEVSMRRYGRRAEDLDESEAKELAAWIASEVSRLLADYRYIRIRVDSEYVARLIWLRIRRAACKGDFACQHSMYARDEDVVIRPSTLAGMLASSVNRDVSIDIRDVIGFLKVVGAQAIEVVAPNVYYVMLRIAYETRPAVAHEQAQ